MTPPTNEKRLPATLVAASFKPASFFRDYPKLPPSVPAAVVYGIGYASSVHVADWIPGVNVFTGFWNAIVAGSRAAR